MTETQKRIRAYKRALPHMKERVIAVALLLAMSVSMMTSATFAWITLSTNPEVSSLATTIATNGNLEIALSDTDGLEPDETAIGDGGQVVTLSNLTWGNLINLSDASYGLDQLTLRPAILNSGSLLDSPLYSVEYGSDGRITELVSDFAFTNYGTKDGAEAFFVPDETQYGVRAISSVTYSSVTGDALLVGLSNEVARNQGYAIQTFQSLYGNKSYMSSITGLAGVYLQYRMDDADQDCTDYVEVLYKMMDEYEDTLLLVGDTLLSIANLQHFVYCNKNGVTYNAFTLTQLNSGEVKTALAAEGIALDTMEQYLADYTTFFGTAAANYTDGLWPRFQTNVYNVWSQGGSIGWELLRNYINPFADINSATVNGTAASAIGADDMASIAFASSKVCVVHNGLIVNMDKILGTELSITNVPMTAMGMNITITEIKTAAESPYYLQEDVKDANRTAESGGLKATDAVAADTYGMAVDFWVRTNAADSLLILEGELQYQTVDLVDAEGNPVLDDKGNQITETKVVGYAGKNRVWEDDDPDLPILGTSVTQGSGSCYIFYPETPEDQAQALEMLRAMCVAFVGVDENGEGTLLAQADMDVDNAIEDGGRVLVPLQLRAKSIQVEDEEGNLVSENSYHITELEQNIATQITAIVYMDGSRLTNSQVLSSGSIRGQLNIQFGTTEDRISVDNPGLKEEFYNIIVSVADSELTYDPNNLPKTTVTLILNGMEASDIQANFVSYISQTQGARQPSFTFVNTPGTNEWTAEVEFNGPGVYRLRSVQIDGVDYALTEEQIEDTLVTIPGVSVSTVSCTGWNGASEYYHMTANSYYTLEMAMDLSIGSGMSTPKSVQGVFAHESGQNVTVNFTQGQNAWTAKTNFTTSGTYTMTYVVIDGTYVALSPSQYKTLTLNLGMQARVFVTQPVTAAYETELAALEAAEAAALAAATTDEEKETIKATYQAQKDALLAQLNGEEGLKMTVSNGGYQFEYDGSEALYMDVSVIVTDDQGNVMTNLGELTLHYGIGASVANRLDAKLTYNSGNNRYEGRFQLTKPGTYTFQSLEMSSGTIYSATSAPRIAAIAKDPIYYVGKSASYTAYYENIGAENGSISPRPFSVVLGDAPSATVKLTMVNLDLAEDDPNRTVTCDTAVIDTDDAKGLYGYYPMYTNSNGVTCYGAPTDGTWLITGMKVANAYYDGVYYDGVATEDGGTGWLDFSEQVQKDNIETEFFTVINFSISGQPSSNQFDGEFMEDHTVDNLTVTLSDYKGDAIEGAEVELSYTWKSTTLQQGYTLTSGTPSNTEFSDVTTTDGKTFVMEAMNFQLSGQYLGTFKVTIDEVEYDYTKFNAADETTMYSVYNVSWKQPTMTITSVTPGEDEQFTTLTAAGISATKLTVNNVFADYYATVYPGHTQDWWEAWTLPQVSVKLEKAGTYTSATSIGILNAGTSSEKTGSTTFSFENNVANCTLGSQTDDGSLIPDVTVAGKQYFSTVNLTADNGATFSLKLTNTVIINNRMYPPYVTFASTSTDGVALNTVPDIIASTANDKGEFEVTLPTLASWTTDESETLSELPESVDGLTPISGPTTTKVYTSVLSYKTKHDVVTTVYEATAATRTWTNTYEIEYWTDGTNQYQPGTTITIDAAKTLTAHLNVYETPNSSITDTKTYQWTVVTVSSVGVGWGSTSGYTKVDSEPTAQDTGWVLQD